MKDSHYEASGSVSVNLFTAYRHFRFKQSSCHPVLKHNKLFSSLRVVFLNRRTAARYRALASIKPAARGLRKPQYATRFH